MKSRRFLIVMLVAIALVGGLSVSSVGHAQAETPASGLNVSMPVTQQITNQDIARVVDLIFEQRITVEELASFMASLNPQQLETMRQLFSERAGVDVQRDDSDRNNRGAGGVTPTHTFTYVETIENVWTWDYQPKIFASWYYRDDLCDHDASDVEYVFYYPVSTTSATQGNLRWTTTNAQVYAAFMLIYSGNLSAFGFSWSEVRLCIGDRGVAAAGGTSTVANSVFVHY